MRRASHRGQQATTEITRRDHSIIACSRHIHNGVILHAHPVRGESHNQRNTTGEVATIVANIAIAAGPAILGAPRPFV